MPRHLKGRAPPLEPDSVRAGYESHGAAGYYRRHADDYRNPHEPAIARWLAYAVDEWKLDLRQVLDLAAGSGEVTMSLRELGAERIDGIDPFTGSAYLRRTGSPAEPLGFADIAAGALAGRTWSLIVCSFALHLCERSRLPSVCWQLSQASPALLILTPHKRPSISKEWGWTLREEKVRERVRGRLYASVAK